MDNFYTWKDIVGKKVSKLRSIAELRAFYGIPLVNGKQSHDAITNKKQEKFDQLNANNVIKQSGVHILCKKFKNIYNFGMDHLKNFKYSRDAFFLDLSIHVNKCQIHFVTQPLKILFRTSQVIFGLSE